MALSKILPASQEQYTGARNMIFNGAQNVAQRGAAGGTATTSASYLSVDRFKSDIDGSGGGDFSHAQVEDAPLGQGFRYASKITTVTQAAQPTSESNRHQFYTLLEKQNTFHLDWGTSSAKTCTLSFWVKGSITGTYGFSFAHYGGSGGSIVSYYYYTNYTIDSANTWEKKTITVAGPTLGGNERDSNSFGTRIEWLIGVGSDAETGTLNEWTTSSTYRLAPNSVYLPENSGATLYITGVQFEVGETATPFEHEDYGTTLTKCQRYYYQIDASLDMYAWQNSTTSQTQRRLNMFWPVAMRDTPNVSFTSAGSSETTSDASIYSVRLFATAPGANQGTQVSQVIAEKEL